MALSRLTATSLSRLTAKPSHSRLTCPRSESSEPLFDFCVKRWAAVAFVATSSRLAVLRIEPRSRRVLRCQKDDRSQFTIALALRGTAGLAATASWTTRLFDLGD